MKQKIKKDLIQSGELKYKMADMMAEKIQSAVNMILKSLSLGGKIILFGNGGSAADAQHIAAELVGRFNKDRKSLPAIALTTNTSILTSLSNDYDFKFVFLKQLEGLLNKKDIVIAISTSGSSPNILLGVRFAKGIGAKIIGLTGKTGGKIGGIVDLCLKVPSEVTCRIQEGHITIGHIICGLVEESLVNKKLKLR